MATHRQLNQTRSEYRCVGYGELGAWNELLLQAYLQVHAKGVMQLQARDLVEYRTVRAMTDGSYQIVYQVLALSTQHSALSTAALHSHHCFTLAALLHCTHSTADSTGLCFAAAGNECGGWQGCTHGRAPASQRVTRADCVLSGFVIEPYTSEDGELHGCLLFGYSHLEYKASNIAHCIGHYRHYTRHCILHYIWHCTWHYTWHYTYDWI